MEKSSNKNTTIKNWAIDDRPREKLEQLGADKLSNSELLAIIINNGNTEKSALDLAKDILKLCNDELDLLGKLTLADLQKIKGIGIAKAVRIAAALELGNRRNAGDIINKIQFKSSADVAKYLSYQLKDKLHEVFAVLFLNQANKVKAFKIISSGGITGTVADPRVILRHAIEESATNLILCHNHPSGNLTPSKADHDITQKIKHAASFLDIKVLDHIIVSDEGYYSFADEGLI
ncbi:DNA repair protein RadC [Ferruginibacter yonginensis]|uniref:DNA repair protein RadC n=1 Tax=Ferruginibacter yonginensis TaxID=1310416 RepID=A0ABV8QQ50_9BACT